MRQMATRNRMMAAVAAALVVAGRAMAQEQEQAEDRGQAPSLEPERRIVVSIADRKLALLEDGEVAKVYDIAVGAPKSPSPNGTFKVINRVPNPTWYHAGKAVGPGKNNPVGTRWIGLSEKGYGIHGTNTPSSIGHNVSHGCIRMRNRDVEQLFELVKAGDIVELHDEVDAVVARIFHAEEPVTIAAAGGGAR